MPTRLHLARRMILDLFDQHQTKVFRRQDLEAVLSMKREEWRLARSTTLRAFLEYLTKNAKLRRLDFPFAHRNEIRYTWGEVPLFAILLTLKPKCHFSHYTAVQMHELTEQDPKSIYVNFEQPAKPSPMAELEQKRIDAAFARKPRVTNNVAQHGDVRIFLLNGKCTGYLGVETREVVLADTRTKLDVRLTDVERTLIDIAVRPFYAGGVGEVVKAYQRAAGKASVNRLAALLSKLDYVYPYHQAIGFYMERAGAYGADAIRLFRTKFRQEFDFYLTYEMGATRYDPRWRLFVPEGF